MCSTTHTLGSCKNLACQACSKILHILPENLVCLLKNLANCKRNGHNQARTCKNLTSTGLQDFLQALQPCKTLILHARILQESCKISIGILQDEKGNLARLLYCMHMDCCYGNQLLHPHPFSLRLFYTIISSHSTHNNNNYYNTNNCAFVVTDMFILL